MLKLAAVRAARPQVRAYKLGDALGLYLHVAPTGTKSWRFRFRDAARREQTLTLGLWPEVSLDDARAWRDQARAQLARGDDPRSSTTPTADVRTFESAARAWHAHRASTWSPVHAADVLDSLERDALPAIGALALDAVTRPSVLQLLEVVEARGAAETARRLRQRIGAVYEFARAKGWATESPADVGEALAHGGAGGRQPALSDTAELAALMRAVAELDAAPIARLASRFLALTTVRLACVRGMCWGEVEDLDDREPLWRVPAAHLKLSVDAKLDPANDHLVPLSPAAAGVLRAARAIAAGAAAPDQLVFPGRRGGNARIGAGAIGGLYVRAGYAGRHVPHGWRASFSTVMNELHLARETRAAIEMTLGHQVKDMSKVERAYNRAKHLADRRALLEEWAGLIASASTTAEVAG